MKIESIEAERFTAFERVSAEFSPGLNVFIGANATGKTHLLKLLYALSKTLEQPRSRAKTRSAEELQLKLREKLERVFNPEEAKCGRLVKRGQGRDHSRILVKCSNGHADFKLTKLGRLSLMQAKKLPAPNGCLFLPSREFLSAYEGFIAAYQSRELSFDETYYDLCLALSAKPLRGPRGDRAAALLEPLRKALPFKTVLQKNRFYITAPGQGKIEAHLVAEGYRKLASIVHLINNGALARNGVIFWDEPAANLNPKMTVHLAKLLLLLVREGVQVFIATHDYLLVSELSLAMEYPEPGAKQPQLTFSCFHRPSPRKPVEISQGSTLAELEHNPILEEFAAHYERERALFYGEGRQ